MTPHAPCRYEVALFDLDGTLTDPYLGIARSFRYALDALEIPLAPDYDFRAAIGPPMQGVVASLVGSNAVLQTRAIALYREYFATVGLFENQLYDGISAMLGRVGKGRALYVCTSKPRVYATRILDHFGIADAFVEVFGSELDGTRSDKRYLLAYAIDRLKIDAARAILIGDRSHDISAARANGTAAAGVAWGYGSVRELADAGARTIFEQPDAVTSIALDAA